MPTDTERLDWLVKHTTPKELPQTFWFRIDNGEVVAIINMVKCWSMRAAIDAAMEAESND